MIIFNEGNSPDREGLIGGTLGGPVGIPVNDTTFLIGSNLQNAQVRINFDALSETRTTENVIAEIVGNKPSSEVVMIGAHLDSVSEGPGINDNGSGSAANLEVARQMTTSKPVHTVRFAWWGAEEAGLLGSQFYVDSLSPTQVNRIALFLNFDMVGSPNFARFIYDGDDSTGSATDAFPIPKGSAQIESVFERFYAGRGLAFEGTAFDGRSDYEAFGLAVVPSGGCSPAPRTASPRHRPPATAARPASRSTRATTRPATPTTTSA